MLAAVASIVGGFALLVRVSYRRARALAAEGGDPAGACAAGRIRWEAEDVTAGRHVD